MARVFKSLRNRKFSVINEIDNVTVDLVELADNFVYTTLQYVVGNSVKQFNQTPLNTIDSILHKRKV